MLCGFRDIEALRARRGHASAAYVSLWLRLSDLRHSVSLTCGTHLGRTYRTCREVRGEDADRTGRQPRGKRAQRRGNGERREPQRLLEPALPE